MTEYVAGVASCADCGGPLTPGPVPEPPKEPVLGPATEPADAGSAEALDTLLATMPGWQADHVTDALVMEGMTCLLECEGQSDVRGPDRGSRGPFAVTLPVSIYVEAKQLGEAKAILESITREDVIGEQWRAEEERQPGESEEEQDTADLEVGELPIVSPTRARESQNGYVESNEFAPGAEGTGLRVVLLLAVAVCLLLWLVA